MTVTAGFRRRYPSYCLSPPVRPVSGSSAPPLPFRFEARISAPRGLARSTRRPSRDIFLRWACWQLGALVDNNASRGISKKCLRLPSGLALRFFAAGLKPPVYRALDGYERHGAAAFCLALNGHRLRRVERPCPYIRGRRLEEFELNALVVHGTGLGSHVRLLSSSREPWFQTLSC